jgi:hypothetical protein
MDGLTIMLMFVWYHHQLTSLPCLLGQMLLNLYGRKLLIFVFVPDKPFHPSLMFVGKAEANPVEEPFRCSILG